MALQRTWNLTCAHPDIHEGQLQATRMHQKVLDFQFLLEAEKNMRFEV